MSAAMAGAIAGGTFAQISNLIGLRSQNKSVIGQIQREGRQLASQMKQININREQLDRELGDILSSNALETAKNMATAKVIMSTSGTVGGTTAQVSKQAYMEQIMADAEVISQARNSEVGMLTDAISKQMNFRYQADAYRSSIKSPFEAMIGTMSAAISGASSGAMLGQGVSGALPTNSIVPSTSIMYNGTSASQRMSARNLDFNNYIMAQG